MYFDVKIVYVERKAGEMDDRQTLVAVLELAGNLERRFAERLDPSERAAVGTDEQPSAKDVLAHVAGAKLAMRDALVAARAGGQPDPAHDRGALHARSRARPFAEVAAEAERATLALLAEVERLDD